jgi:hypothetical protein
VAERSALEEPTSSAKDTETTIPSSLELDNGTGQKYVQLSAAPKSPIDETRIHFGPSRPAKQILASFLSLLLSLMFR